MLVAVATPKTRMINVRLTEKVHEEFKIACELRGVSMSSLLHQFVIRVIREEREMSPQAFKVLFSKIPQDQVEDRLKDGVEMNTDKVATVRHEQGEVVDDQDQTRTRDSRTITNTKTKRKATR